MRFRFARYYRLIGHFDGPCDTSRRNQVVPGRTGGRRSFLTRRAAMHSGQGTARGSTCPSRPVDTVPIEADIAREHQQHDLRGWR
jgi:hypothetical protein